MLTEREIIVYCLDPKLLNTRVELMMPDFLKANQSLHTASDGIVMVKGGYLLIDTDCCYRESDTELRTLNGKFFDIVERFRIYFEVREFEIKGSTTYTKNNKFRFITSFDCDKLIKGYCLPETKKLCDFMGGRYNYNPRITKNMKTLINIINELQTGEQWI